jgi:hypothetical protein
MPDDRVHGREVQVATEPLELRREQDGVSVVDLQSCVSPSTAIAADRLVRGLDFVERILGGRVPTLKRYRRHGGILKRFRGIRQGSGR